MFNDNRDGTLTIVGQADQDDTYFEACVISQNAIDGTESLPPHSHPLDEGLQERTKLSIRRSGTPADFSTASGLSREVSQATAHANGGNAADTVEARPSMPLSTGSRPRSPLKARKGTSESLELAMATSDTWRILQSLVSKLGGNKAWLASHKGADDLERRALAQLISLPPRNQIDREWLDGIRRSNQQRLKQTICILIAIVGFRGPCQACQKRAAEKRRHCAALPPQAKDMDELQQLVGNTCSECYHFPTKGDCGFPSRTLLGTQTSQVLVSKPAQSTNAQAAQTTENDFALIKPLAQPVLGDTVIPTWPISKTHIPQANLLPVPAIPLQEPHRHQAASRQGRSRDNDVARGVGDEANSTRLRDIPNMAGHHQSINITALSADDGANSRGSFSVPKDSKNNQARMNSASTGLRISSADWLSKALGLLTEVSQLPTEKQSGVFTKIIEMVEVIRRPTMNLDVDCSAHISSLTAEEWEIAPGRLTVSAPSTGRESRIAFSTSYLRREVIDVDVATDIACGRKVVNRYIPALQQIVVDKFDARWDCDLTVLEGYIQVKVGRMEAKIGQGGIFVISQDETCFITNITHRECPIQIRWVERR